ncbi:Glycosyl hydrolase family protein with chitinase insertion domain [Salix suchowensis]|nr:Glycosyl hydrolase family protein with chitinase insertion domain [Salix suchowensis]
MSQTFINLAYGIGLQKMTVADANKTVLLNGAIYSSSKSRGTLRAFTLVEILEGRMDKIAETWVSVCGEEHVLFQHGNQLSL